MEQRAQLVQQELMVLLELLVLTVLQAQLAQRVIQVHKVLQV
jgi:hypothetical protein